MPRVQPPSRDEVRESAARAALVPVLEFLADHAPFDRMAPEHREQLARRLRLGFYARGELITGPDQGPADTFYIIKQGRVRGEAGDSGPAEEGAWELSPGECFPIGALLARRPVRTANRAVEDSFCFELAREDFDQLLALSPEFHDFCTRRLASLLDQTLRHVQASLATEFSSDASLNAPLANLVRRAPVTCSPKAKIREALVLMHTERVGSIVMVDEQHRPEGMFTLHDLLSRVAVTELSIAFEMWRVMSTGVHTLPPQASAHEAAVLMARQGFGHICVVEGDRLVGVVSERDLFSLQRIGLVSLSRAITHAPDIDSLKRHGQDVHRLIDQMLVQGASVGQLTQIITLLNDHITRRVIELVIRSHGQPPVPFTWLSFGSEGRQEQTLKTDQDNGMLFVPPAGASAEELRTGLLPLARAINEALDACGYPLCKGNIMASNPECCLSLEEWQARFAKWIDQGAPEHLLNASIFFDLRVLWGEEAPAAELRRRVLEHTATNPRFLRQMAGNALRNTPPLGLVREFVVESGGEHANQIDLKMRGTTPFVDGARLLALSKGLGETSTTARLRAAARAGLVREDEAEAWCDAYSFVQLLRMRTQQAHERAGRAPDNYVNPDALNELDRRILKEAFRQARKLQARFSLDYQL